MLSGNKFESFFLLLKLKMEEFIHQKIRNALFRVKVLFGTNLWMNAQNGFLYNFLLATFKSGLVWPVQKSIETALKDTELAKNHSFASLVRRKVKIKMSLAPTMLLR